MTISLKEAWQCVLRDLWLPIGVSVEDVKQLVSVEDLAMSLCCVGDWTEFSVGMLAREMQSKELYEKWYKLNKEFEGLYK